MVISYDKLWKLLIDKKMNKTDLKDQAGITYNIIARLGKGEPVSMESLYKICRSLECNIGDIMEFKFD
ncbi:helix-turn-helix domain-containing protein [Aerococcus urinaeequi]|uniref:helix-turn-helix domain-containing protein n=1 Tax=Aerococcus urinaeequi TaxID=51665 RepID=UPI00265795B7|nr:putative transcriptional regulator [Anaerophaga sp.]